MEQSQRFRKSRVDCSRREARRIGGSNEAGDSEDEYILILSSDKEMSTSVTERVSQMLSSTPAFTGISGSAISLNPKQHYYLPPQTEIIEASDVTQVFEGPEVTVSSRPVRNQTQEEH